MFFPKNPTPGRSAAAVVAGLLLAAMALSAQNQVVMLWPNGAPGSEKWTQKEAEIIDRNVGLKAIRNISKPSITAFLPKGESTGTSVIVAPGGGFRIVSWELEGTLVADWLRQHGIAAFVLKYRLSDTGTDAEWAESEARAAAARRGGAGAPGRGRGAGESTAGRGPAGAGQQAQIRAMAAADGLRAIEVVREHAAEWHIDPAKVGIMGFSAGGYVAVQAALEHTPANRPAFVASIYGCCENPAEIKIPDDAPPIFFLHAYNDPVSVSTPALYMAWKAANKPAELHSFAAGGHGFGMPRHNLPTDGWIELFGNWLRYQNLMR